VERDSYLVGMEENLVAMAVVLEKDCVLEDIKEVVLVRIQHILFIID